MHSDAGVKEEEQMVGQYTEYNGALKEQEFNCLISWMGSKKQNIHVQTTATGEAHFLNASKPMLVLTHSW